MTIFYPNSPFTAMNMIKNTKEWLSITAQQIIAMLKEEESAHTKIAYQNG
jgi:hypothetical protein